MNTRMSAFLKSAAAILLIHLPVMVKGQPYCVEFSPPIDYSIIANCKYNFVTSSFPVIRCIPTTTTTDPISGEVSSNNANYCVVLIKTPEPLIPVCVVDMSEVENEATRRRLYYDSLVAGLAPAPGVSPAFIDDARQLAEVAQRRRDVFEAALRDAVVCTPPVLFDDDECFSWALTYHQDDDIRDEIRRILAEVTIGRCFGCNIGNQNVNIPPDNQCNAHYISEAAKGKVVADNIDEFSPEQKFIRYICYLQREVQFRTSLFFSFLPPGNAATGNMLENPKVCNFNDLLSCKTLALDIGGTRTRVNTCLCNDYDSVDLYGECHGKPLAPCGFGPDSFLSKEPKCVSDAVCKELATNEDLKKRFLEYYKGVAQHDFIKEYITHETTHACDCAPTFVATAAGGCISQSPKIAISPFLLLFATIFPFWGHRKIYR